MFFAVQITDNWLISTAAKGIYVVAAFLTVAYVGLLTAVVFGTVLAGGTLAKSTFVLPILKILFFPCAVAMALIYVGMVYFWVRCHSNESTSKTPWMALMMGLGPFGALFYFAFFYLRSPLVRSAPKEQATTA